jgi:hypothetical protein
MNQIFVWIIVIVSLEKDTLFVLVVIISHAFHAVIKVQLCDRSTDHEMEKIDSIHSSQKKCKPNHRTRKYPFMSLCIVLWRHFYLHVSNLHLIHLKHSIDLPIVDISKILNSLAAQPNIAYRPLPQKLIRVQFALGVMPQRC